MDVRKIEENMVEGAQELRAEYSVSPLVAGGIAALAYFLGKKAGYSRACQAVAEGIIQRHIEDVAKGAN